MAKSMTDPASPSPVLGLFDIKKSFGENLVLDGIDLQVHAGELLAIMGENGAGKSTMMNIISGSLSSYDGTIEIDGEPAYYASPKEAEQAGIVMVHQEMSLVPEMTIAENIFLGREPTKKSGTIDFKAMNKRAEGILAQFNFRPNPKSRVVGLRVAEMQLVEIAKAIARDARVLILDEPTAALNDEESEKLFTILRDIKKQGIAILYISHRMDEVFNLSDRILVLRNGVITGNQQTSNTTPTEIITQMIGGELKKLAQHPPAYDDAIFLEVKRLYREYSGPSAIKYSLKDVTFSLRKGEILGIAGLLGAGRTELLEIIAGSCPDSWCGDIQFKGASATWKTPQQAIGQGVGFVTEARKETGLILDQSVKNNISLVCLQQLSQFGWMSEAAENAVTLQMVEGTNMKFATLDQPVGELSGGNQQKVVLSKWLAAKPELLLLDEPTRGVDVGAKTEIYSILYKLAEQGISQIIASSDLPELTRLCHRIVILHEGEIIDIMERADFDQQQILGKASLGHRTSVKQAEKVMH